MKQNATGCPLVLVAALLSGCAAYEANRAAEDAKRAEIESTRPICLSDRQCERMWSAAEAWVGEVSGWKVQTATANLIETYNSNDSRLAVRVRREPHGSDGYRFTASAWCGVGFWACEPDELDAVLAFNQRLNALK